MSVFSPLTISASGGRIHSDPAPLADIFHRHGAIELRGLLDPAFVELLLARISRTTWETQEIGLPGARLVEAHPRPITNALRLSLGCQAFLDCVRSICGVTGALRVNGEMAEMRAATEQHFLSWHDDQNEPRRRLGFTINLSDECYEGGEFEMRPKGVLDPRFRHRHTHVGSMLLFSVSNTSEHRVLPVLTGGPRRVFSGGISN